MASAFYSLSEETVDTLPARFFLGRLTGYPQARHLNEPLCGIQMRWFDTFRNRPLIYYGSSALRSDLIN